MVILLRKATITQQDDYDIGRTFPALKIQTIEEKHFLCFHWKKKVITEVTNPVYEYWIEFHVDQGWFCYGEYKPVLLEGSKDVYVYQRSVIHTKRDVDRSLEIISDIVKRTKELFPSWKIELFNHPNMAIFRKYNKNKTGSSD